MSLTCRNMAKFVETQLHELEHESNMRILKTHSRRARVVKGMAWKPIVISCAGSRPADDAIR